MGSSARQAKTWLKPYQWPKGKSGNPGGRPKSKTIAAAYRARLAELADKDGTFAEAVADAQIKKALKGDTFAIREITDRTEGKPSQTVELTGQIALRGYLVDRTVRPPRQKEP